ncbi:MAG TPA: PfkB family carbohydrate kinase [Pantanalinema sp.]
MSNITIVGSVALDSVRTPRGEVIEALGGSATHASMSASFFSPVNLVGVVGTDFPEEHVELFRSRRVNVEGLQRVEGKTFRWKGFYDEDLNTAHTLMTDLNVFADFQPKLPQNYAQSEYLFLGNIDPELQSLVLDQMERPKLVVCDTMNFWITSKRAALVETLKRVDIALLNEGEARQLCETNNLLKAAKRVLELGPKAVIIKKGEDGAMLVQDNGHIFISPTYPIEEVSDPTGAGDSFAGGFLGYLAYTDDLSNENLRRAIILGSVMASYNVEEFSCDRLRSVTHEEILKRYNVLRKMSGFEKLGDTFVPTVVA